MVTIERALRELEVALLDLHGDMSSYNLQRYGEAKRKLMTLIERRGT